MGFDRHGYQAGLYAAIEIRLGRVAAELAELELLAADVDDGELDGQLDQIQGLTRRARQRCETLWERTLRVVR